MTICQFISAEVSSERKIFPCIVIADISDNLAGPFQTIGQFAILDVLSKEVAQQPAEILVPRVGQKAARTGKHPYQAAQHTHA